MESFTEDLWAITLARLPLKIITTSKLVCKQWKSIVESPFFQEIFMSHHQNSQPSWSLMCRDAPEEVVSHYGCKIWGLPQSLNSYISSFITAKFDTKKENKTRTLWARAVAYTDVGLVLIYATSIDWKRTYYVANPVSQQHFKISSPPIDLLQFEKERVFMNPALVTRVENGVVLSYKVVLIEAIYMTNECYVNFITYSSETGLWSSNTLQSPLPLFLLDSSNPIINLNGNLHWLGVNLKQQDVVISYDLYGSDDHQQCRVIHFPDLGKNPNFKRSCTTSQGNLMYMNIYSQDKDDGSKEEHKLSVWKLMKDEWQIVFELSPDFIETGFDYFPLAINPFDGYTMYLWSDMYNSFTSINLRNGNSKVHCALERSSSNGQTLSCVDYVRETDAMECLSESYFSTFVLPRWLYQIPRSPC